MIKKLFSFFLLLQVIVLVIFKGMVQYNNFKNFEFKRLLVYVFINLNKDKLINQELFF